MKLGLIVVLITLMTVITTDAEARFYFGTDESLKFVADVDLQGPHGEDLTLSRKISRKNFLAPYVITDDGFVLAVKGSRKGVYYGMPTGEELIKYQQSGHLPNPLPNWEMSLVDRLFGYFLWEFLGVVLIWSLIKRAFWHR